MILIGCGGCPSVWTGLRAAHCAACHATFSGPTVFDLHQRAGACLAPASVGLVLDDVRDVWRRPETRTGSWDAPTAA